MTDTSTAPSEIDATTQTANVESDLRALLLAAAVLLAAKLGVDKQYVLELVPLAITVAERLWARHHDRTVAARIAAAAKADPSTPVRT